jgi:hypothetical protein
MEGQDQGDELYPIAVLIDELKVRTSELLLEFIRNIINSATDTRHSMTMSSSA